eukprot:COSAG02_NODE_15731_length_1145_cov_2.035373_1_plen_142_part_10
MVVPARRRRRHPPPSATTELSGFPTDVNHFSSFVSTAARTSCVPPGSKHSPSREAPGNGQASFGQPHGPPLQFPQNGFVLSAQEPAVTLASLAVLAHPHKVLGLAPIDSTSSAIAAKRRKSAAIIIAADPPSPRFVAGFLAL